MSDIAGPYAGQTTSQAGQTLPPEAGRRNRLAAWSMAAVLTLLSVLAGVAPTASAEVAGGQVAAWGFDNYGQTDVPTALDGKNVTAVAAGQHHSLALTSDGQVAAWGDDGYGQSSVPSSLTGQTVTAVAAGYGHSLALTSDGQVTAWGWNENGQTSVPSWLAGKMVKAVAAGFSHSLALTADGQITAWGSNEYGQTQLPSVLSGKTVTAVAAGSIHNLALTSDGKVLAWGYNNKGQTDVPSSLGEKTVTAVAAGGLHNLALTSDGRVVAWGHNTYGQSTVPSTLADKTVTDIAAGSGQSLAVIFGSQVVGWGDDTSDETTAPEALTGRAVTAIAGGGDHSLAISQAGAVPTVGTHPVSVTAQVGDTASFTATATGTPEPTVQWQRASRGSFADIPGANDPTYTISSVTVEDDNTQFRVVFSNALGTAVTDPAELTVNSPPKVAGQSVTTPYGKALGITLTGTDPDGDLLSFAVTRQPTHGKLGGFGPNLTYTADAGYTGADSLTYTASDGTTSSAPATVTIQVTRPGCAVTAPHREFTVSTDRPHAGFVRSGRISTRRTGQLLVAFVAVNGPTTGTQSVFKVTGGGLTWTLVQRENATSGSSEIWQAYAASRLHAARVTATFSQRGYSATMTVAGFSHASTTTRPAHASGSRSAPSVTLTPQASQSKVWAVGRVTDSRYMLRAPRGQYAVHAVTFRSPKASYWVQQVETPTTTGKAISVHSKSATAHPWGYAAVEIQGNCRLRCPVR